MPSRKLWRTRSRSTGDGLGAPVISVQVDFLKSNENSVASTQVVVQEFRAIYEPECFFNLLNIYDLFSSFQFQHDTMYPCDQKIQFRMILRHKKPILLLITCQRKLQVIVLSTCYLAYN